MLKLVCNDVGEKRKEKFKSHFFKKIRILMIVSVFQSFFNGKRLIGTNWSNKFKLSLNKVPRPNFKKGVTKNLNVYCSCGVISHAVLVDKLKSL